MQIYVRTARIDSSQLASVKLYTKFNQIMVIKILLLLLLLLSKEKSIYNGLMQQSKFVFSRFVSEDLDDYEGRLTREGVKNFYGIVKFEIARIYTLDTNEPLTGWENIIPLQETYTFKDKLQDGMSFVSLF